ncbi:MAG: hypothetical protein AMXMBFR13_18230 [Phycisphaerae bacterium]
MLHRTHDLRGHKLGAIDGEIGRVEDFYFDDHSWRIRYLVADTGTWLSGRLVLISPAALGHTDWGSGVLPVHLSREQIENSPPIESEPTVSRQREKELANYYGWPIYWAPPPGAYAGGTPTAVPEAVEPYPYGTAGPNVVVREKADRPGVAPRTGDPHLRGAREVSGYYIEARDGDIGHVDDFIVDDDEWLIRYMVVDTRNWWPGKKVLVSPHTIQAVNWDDSRVHVELTKDQIRNGPSYDETLPLDREYETRLSDYYEWPRYWI